MFYFLSSSISRLMPFGRELPSMTSFAELMHDLEVSELESISALHGLGPPYPDKQRSFCSVGIG